MKYFDHDTTASGDDKIVSLRLECGGDAVDAYWVILEQLYRDETPLDIFGNQHLTRSVCHRLVTDAKTLETYVLAMVEIGLLNFTDENKREIYSPRASKNIKAYTEKCETARQNGKKGGRKPKAKPNANQDGNQTLTDGETKAKANKRKEKKDIGTHKEYLISDKAPAVAAAAKAAPTDERKPFCPMCDTPVWKNTQTGRYRCGTCFDEYDEGKAVWR